MTSSHLFAFSKEAICVAEDSSVAFYAPKNLKKFRVERLSGRRIVGLYALPTTSGETHLHIVDAEANWFIISLTNIELLSSSSINWGNESKTLVGDKPVISARRGIAKINNALKEQGVVEAHFHEAGNELHCVLLTLCGVYEISLRDKATMKANKIISFPQTILNCTMSIGRMTGLVIIAQRGEKWAQYSLFDKRDPNNTKQIFFPINMQSIACSPVTQSVAVGGIRGELIVYPSIKDNHHFSDHWHHTPLTALGFSVDGNSLFSGARESIMLVWNMSSYAFRKIGCSLGPIRCIIPSSSDGSQLLLACSESTLATLDLLQMKIDKSIEGVQWSIGEACSGLVVGNWMGQPAVILTGLPNVVRICDPYTQQSLYSLHISSQMETIPNPPRHGIQHVGILNGNRTIVTYEEFGGTALPSLLRFWVYDGNLKKHIEAQTIYSPHTSNILMLKTDEINNRVFTLSVTSIKCWGELNEDVNDAYATGKKGWSNKSSSSTPSNLVKDMILSNDGSLCLVSDDNIHIYSVENVYPGQPWTRILTLTQSLSLSPLRNLQLISDSQTVVAHDGKHVFFWSLASPQTRAEVWVPANDNCINCLCAYASGSVLAATTDGTLWELSKEENNNNNNNTLLNSNSQLKAIKQIVMGGGGQLSLAAMSPLLGGRLAAVDSVSGFRVLHLTQETNNNNNNKDINTEMETGVPPVEFTPQLQDFFHDVVGRRGENNNDNDNDEEISIHSAMQAAEAKKWLTEVLADSAYTAPPMSSVLSSYLKKRAGIPIF